MWDWVWYAFFARRQSGISSIALLVLAVAVTALAGGFRTVFDRSRSPASMTRRVVGIGAYIVWSFSTLYYLSGTKLNFAGGPLSRIDALYLALGILSTAGTTNIGPVSEIARSFVTIQYVVDILLIAFVIGVLTNRLSSK